MTTSPAAISCIRLVEGGPGRAELALLLELDQLVAGEVDLLLGHVAFVSVLDQPGAFEAERGVHDADCGHVEDRGLAFEFRIDQILPFRDFMADEVGAIADGVGVVDLRQEGRPFGHAVAQIGRIGLGDIHGLVGRDALARDLVTVDLALGKDRQDVVELLDLLDLDALDHAALGSELGPASPRDRRYRPYLAGL
ncbi:hypothetical protein ACVWXM_005732 [Bradyrhizobium sp. GM7.3]